MSGPVYNFPDVLGTITDAERATIGAAQVVMAVRPSLVRAGRPFEVIMLIQNTVDAPVDVRVTLKIPDADAAGKKGRILTGTERLVVGIEPGEVGYVTLPVTTLPDTAVSRDYHIGMDIQTEVQEKGAAILRGEETGPALDLTTLPEERREKVQALQKLKFSAAMKRGALRRGHTLEANFSILAGKAGKIVDLKPGWVSLWQQSDHTDDSLLLDKYAELLRLKMVPKLRRDLLFPPLQEKVAKTFKASGYALRDIEVNLIAKLMTLILEYANAARMSHGATAGGMYNITPLIAERSAMFVPEGPPVLPHWTRTFLQAVSRDTRVATVPHRAIPHFAFDALLRDSVMYSFHLVEIATGVDLGSEAEKDEYASRVLEKLGKRGQMDFMHAYLPLMMGGILTFDQVMIDGQEELKDYLSAVRTLLGPRSKEQREENAEVFDMTDTIIMQTIKKFGFVDKM